VAGEEPDLSEPKRCVAPVSACLTHHPMYLTIFVLLSCFTYPTYLDTGAPDLETISTYRGLIPASASFSRHAHTVAWARSRLVRPPVPQLAMKFGHAFEEALQAHCYPEHWVEKAIPYRQLKKVLGKVREELVRQGYDAETLHQLLADHNAKYSLESSDSHLLRPRLVVRPVPGALPALEEPCANIEGCALEPSPRSTSSVTVENTTSGERVQYEQHHPWIKIPLGSDARFFNILQTDVDELDTLQSQERRTMSDSIVALGNEISVVAKPRRSLINVSRSDLYRWREIFELYLAAQVFFSTTETSGGVRTSEGARKQLVWFQDEVGKRQLLQKFKLEASANAYTRFLALNATLLQNVQFQELNKTAVNKIIKSKRQRLLPCVIPD